MQKELIISTTSQETKIAIQEDSELVEFYIERHRSQGIVGNIYKGRVTKVLPGMQSAFVDVGLERDAFLYVSDFLEDVEEYEKIVATAEDEANRFAEKDRKPVEVVTAPPAAVEVPPPVAAPPAEEPERRQTSESREEPAGDSFSRRPRRRDRDRRGGRRPRIPSFEGRESRFEGRPERREDRPAVDREPERRDGPAESYRPLEVLPGESLAKYSGREPEPEESLHSRPELDRDLPDEAPKGTLESVEDSIQAPGPLGVPNGELASEIGTSDVPERPVTVTPTVAPVEPVEAPSPEELRSETADRDATPVAVNDSPAAEAEEAESDSGGEPDVEGQSGNLPTTLEDNAEGDRQPSEPTSARVAERGDRFQFSKKPGRRPRGGRRGPPPRNDDRPTSFAKAAPMISELLREGQEILVQVAKEPLGKKGARITSHIALPGRYLVYMPTVDHVGVSRKIGSDEERARLRRIIQEHRVGLPGGFIVRTAGDGQPEEEFVQDIRFLGKLWADIRARGEKKSGPALIHRELSPVQRMLRDQLSPDFRSIRLDNEAEFATVLEFVNRFQPSLVSRVKLHLKDTPIFEEFGLTSEIEKALRPKVWLKSGGYVVINQTEALVAIDVNTGKYVGKSNRLEDTIVRTNIEAAQEVVRQIRLRNLGGIIVVDFIDMEERKNRAKIMAALEEALRADRSPSKILQFNDFGLVAITRKRTQPSLERTLGSPCPQCGGAGWVKSVETICYEILQDLKKMTSMLTGSEVTIRVNPAVGKALKSGEFVTVQEMEEWTRKDVVIKIDPLLGQEHFDIF